MTQAITTAVPVKVPKPHTGWGAALIALVLALSPTQGEAQATIGPFSALAGDWSGDGTVTMSSGQRERLRCRANYAVGQSGGNLRLSIRCASDSYKFDLASDVASKGGTISGVWSEAGHNATGTIIGHTSGDSIQAHARGNAFSANLSWITHGNRQSVIVRPQGTAVTTVSLALSRK